MAHSHQLDITLTDTRHQNIWQLTVLKHQGLNHRARGLLFISSIEPLISWVDRVNIGRVVVIVVTWNIDNNINIQFTFVILVMPLFCRLLCSVPKWKVYIKFAGRCICTRYVFHTVSIHYVKVSSANKRKSPFHWTDSLHRQKQGGEHFTFLYLFKMLNNFHFYLKVSFW